MTGNAKEFDDFGQRNNMRWTRVLSNGEYTKAWYKNGKIYTLNPNYPRKEFEYFSRRKPTVKVNAYYKGGN